MLHESEMEEFIKEKHINVAILAVPDQTAQATADRIISYGIHGILNFTTIQLKTANHVYVNNMDINGALETVIFYTHQQRRNSPAEKSLVGEKTYAEG